MTEPTPGNPPIVCDMTDAPDTAEERLAEYQLLFGEMLVGRERVGNGIRFRFRASAGVEDHIRDLAAREKACCGFFTFQIATHGDQVWWDATVVDDSIARQILDEFYRLPDTVHEGVTGLYERFDEQGLTIVKDDDGVLRPATPEEIGLST